MSDLKNSLQTELNNDNNANNYKKRGRPPKVTQPAKIVGPATQSSAPMGASLSDDSRANRPKRTPVGSQNRLMISKRPGYHTRVVKVRRGDEDLTGRVQQFLDAGYVPREGNFQEYARSKDPSVLGSNYISLGRGDYGIVMDQKLEYYTEDQAAKVENNKKRMEKLKKVKHVGTDTAIDGQYGNLKIDN